MKDYVNGTVLDYDGNNVYCNVQLEKRCVNLNIPRKYFDTHVFYGMNITIRMVDGTPVITKRKENKEELKQRLKEGLEEIDDLIEKILE